MQAAEVHAFGAVWTHEEMTYFTTEKVFNSIPQKGIERYLQRKWMGVRGASNMLSLFKEFVESVMYKQLATLDASADYESALELATVCHEPCCMALIVLAGRRAASAAHAPAR